MQTYKEMMFPILRLFSDRKEYSRSDVYQFIVKYFSLTEQQISERIKSGQALYKNRVDWAITYLSTLNNIPERQKLLLRISRGIYQITELGFSIAKDEKLFENIMAKSDSLSELHTALTLEIVKNFKNTKFPAKYVADAYSGFTYDQLKEVLDPTSGYYKEESLKAAKEHLASLELRRPGLMYTDLVMKDMNDKEIKLSQYAGKGNYVFVDFWASWCGPCRAEMPNVVEAYNKYHAKGLEIVGVSFDQKKDAWTAMVKKLGMEWPQMSDLKGWQCAAGKIYGIRSIPSNILLDPQGKIVASDLRGEDLQQKLAEIYK